MTPEKLKKYTALIMQRAARNLEDGESNLAAASFNVASSQAYYCMLDAATALLACRAVTPGDEVDAEFIKTFAQHFVLTGDMEAGYRDSFEAALKARVACGYDKRHYETHETARSLVDRAGEFLAAATAQVKKELARLELPDIRQKGEREEHDAELH